MSSSPRAGLKPGKWEHGHSREPEWKEKLRGVKLGPNTTQMPFFQPQRDVARSSECMPFLLCPQGGWVLLEKLNGNWGKSLDPRAHAAHSLLQMYQVTFCSSGTKTFLAFLIMGWGFRSSSANLCFRGLKSSPPGTLDKTRSAGSGLKFTSTSTQFGSMGLGVSLSFSKEDSERERGRWSWKSLDSLNSQGSCHIPRHLLESQGHTNYCCLEGRKTIRAPAPHKPDWHM